MYCIDWLERNADLHICRQRFLMTIPQINTAIDISLFIIDEEKRAISYAKRNKK